MSKSYCDTSDKHIRLSFTIHMLVYFRLKPINHNFHNNSRFLRIFICGNFQRQKNVSAEGLKLFPCWHQHVSFLGVMLCGPGILWSRSLWSRWLRYMLQQENDTNRWRQSKTLQHSDSVVSHLGKLWYICSAVHTIFIFHWT